MVGESYGERPTGGRWAVTAVVIGAFTLIAAWAVYLTNAAHRLAAWFRATGIFDYDPAAAYALILPAALGIFFILRFIDLRRAIGRSRDPGRALASFKETAEKYYDIPGAIMVGLDRKGTFTLINRKGAEVFGYPKDSIVGKNYCDDFLLEDEGERFKTLYRRIMEGDTRFAEDAFEHPVRTRSGKVKIISWRVAVLAREGGDITGILAYGLDVTETIKAESALRASETRFRAVFEKAGIGIVIADHEGRLLSANPAFCSMLGYRVEEILGKRFTEITHPEDVAGSLALIGATLEGKNKNQGARMEKRYIHTDGRTIHARTNISLFPGPKGMDDHVLVLVEDISEQVEARDRLELLSSAVEQSTEGIGVIDLEGNLRFTNKAFAAMHGYTPEAIEGKHLSIFHTFDQMPAVEEANRQILETGAFNGEIQHTRKDGTDFPGFMHNILLRDDEGNPVGILGTLRDITDLKGAEEALRKSEQRYRTTLDYLADGVHVVDAALRIILVNRFFKAWCAELGLEKNLVGLTIFEAFPFLPPKVREEYEQVFRTGETRVTEEKIDVVGKSLVTETRKIPVVESGKVTGVVTVVRDITEQKTMEETIRRHAGDLERLAEERAARIRELEA